MRTIYLLAVVLLAAAVICEGRRHGHRRGSRKERPVVKLEDCFDKERVEEEVKKVNECGDNGRDSERRRHGRRRGRDVSSEEDSSEERQAGSLRVRREVPDFELEAFSDDRHERRHHGDEPGRRQWVRSNRKLGRNLRCLILQSKDGRERDLEINTLKTRMQALTKQEKSEALSEAMDTCSEGKTEAKDARELKGILRCVWKTAAEKICPKGKE